MCVLMVLHVLSCVYVCYSVCLLCVFLICVCGLVYLGVSFVFSNCFACVFHVLCSVHVFFLGIVSHYVYELLLPGGFECDRCVV